MGRAFTSGEGSGHLLKVERPSGLFLRKGHAGFFSKNNPEGRSTKSSAVPRPSVASSWNPPPLVSTQASTPCSGPLRHISFIPNSFHHHYTTHFHSSTKYPLHRPRFAGMEIKPRRSTLVHTTSACSPSHTCALGILEIPRQAVAPHRRKTAGPTRLGALQTEQAGRQGPHRHR